jgi:hypothetical protein
MTAIITPTIHPNGTSGAHLIAEVEDVLTALRAVQDTMRAAQPNARDYYIKGDDIFRQAASQHNARWMAIQGLIDDYMTILGSLVDQQEQKRPR